MLWTIPQAEKLTGYTALTIGEEIRQEMLQPYCSECSVATIVKGYYILQSKCKIIIIN